MYIYMYVYSEKVQKIKIYKYTYKLYAKTIHKIHIYRYTIFLITIFILKDPVLIIYFELLTHKEAIDSRLHTASTLITTRL